MILWPVSGTTGGGRDAKLSGSVDSTAGDRTPAYPGSRFFVATSKKRIQLLVESVDRNRNDVPFGTKAHLPWCIILEQSRGRPAE